MSYLTQISELAKRELQKKTNKHNERLIINEGFIHCARCRNLIPKTDKYCQYCGMPNFEKAEKEERPH